MIGIARRRIPTIAEESSDGRGIIDSYGYVDLGLPSGLLWATCNVGATVETDCGEYYKWGSVIPYPDGEYDAMNSGTLPLTEDAAHVNMGGDWRMPTRDDAQELIDNTVGVKTTINGITGCKFSKTINGVERYIFIPFGGRNNDGNKSFMAIWLSKPYGYTKADKLYCIINNNYVPVINPSYHSGKMDGMNVRGVHQRS